MGAKTVAECGGAGVPGFELRVDNALACEQRSDALLDVERGDVIAQAQARFVREISG